METKENNNQLTLYRFVSLRSPELSKKEDQEKRFVFHPDNLSGEFFYKVRDNLSTQTNWEVMQELSSNPTFIVLKNESEVEDIVDNLNEGFYSLSSWIARNRSNLDLDQLYKKLKEIDVLSGTVELNLWDNLFFQIITQKSFYVKEAIMQILVLQNLLKKIEGKDEDTLISILPLLVNATVVLPFILFESNNTSNETLKRLPSNNEVALSKDFENATKNMLSTITIADYTYTINELKKLEIKYNKEKNDAFNAANKLHQAIISSILKDYEKQYKVLARAMCANPRDENYDPNDFCNQPNIDYPELPEFVFEYQDEIEIKYLTDNLSENAFYILSTNVNLDEIDTFQGAIFILEEKSKSETESIFANTQFAKKVTTIEGIVIPTEARLILDNNINCQIYPTPFGSNKIKFYMSIHVPDNSFSVSSLEMNIDTPNGVISNSSFNSSTSNNVIHVTNIFGDFRLTNTSEEGLPANTVVSRAYGYVKITSNNEIVEYSLEINPFNLKDSFSRFLSRKEDNDQTGTSSFIPKGFGYKQLGIADYKKVVAEICCYEPGEVAHIENVMASELRSKVTTKTEKSEVTDFESSEIEKENMSDSVSTQRFEMQTEVSKLLSEQKQLSAYADVHTSWGSTTLDAGVAYASNTSKEQSNRQAVTQAKELTQRAVERIVSRVKKEKTIKITNEFTETNTHVFDNTGGNEHISGIYRFINAIYKNQIFNYGKRLMYEFTVPQPSQLHRLAMEVAGNNENAVILDKPVDPATLGIKSFTDITPLNYQNFASKYNAQVAVYPEEIIYANKTFSGTKADKNEILEGATDIQIEKGYKATTARLKCTAKSDHDGSQHHTLVIAFGNHSLYKHNSTANLIETALDGYMTEFPLTPTIPVSKGYVDKVSISYASLNYLSINIAFTVKMELTALARENWKKETYEAIIKGYQEQLRIYNEKLNDAKIEGSKILDSNPLFYRQIEQMVLRKNCISYLLDNTAGSSRRFGRKMYTGTTIKDYQVAVNQDMDDYGSFAKFMEQAFEWNIMSYNFYPYYWGNENDWSKLYQFETNDPLFRNFMQAGMARVVVTVKPGFEDAIMHYMTTGQIWNGGQTPILGDSLYLSIVDELKEQEYTVPETWKTVVPTNLIGLQRKGVSVAEDGLPCSCPVVDELNEKLAINGNILKAKA
jgi:hypothetical protein